MIGHEDFKNFNYNVTGPKSYLKGELIFYGDCIINSQVEGTIEVREKGKLILERGSVVRGEIKAIDLEIFGTVEGKIHCSGLVSIRSSAEVTGEIISDRLVIYPGAVVELKATSQNSQT